MDTSGPEQIVRYIRSSVISENEVKPVCTAHPCSEYAIRDRFIRIRYHVVISRSTELKKWKLTHSWITVGNLLYQIDVFTRCRVNTSVVHVRYNRGSLQCFWTLGRRKIVRYKRFSVISVSVIEAGIYMKIPLRKSGSDNFVRHKWLSVISEVYCTV